MISNDMKFNGKYFKELIYLKSREDQKSKSDIRNEIIKKLEVSRQTVSLWAGGLTPGIDNLFKLKKYFNIASIEEFFLKGGKAR